MNQQGTKTQRPILKVPDNTFYVSPTPLIIEGTVEENITLGLPFDEELFRKAIQCAELEEEISKMPDKKNTILGEGGSTISGGQKIRLALARCLYHKPDLILMDCPLAKLDLHVASKIFEKIILDNFEKKTRIMTTNSITYLDKADRILILDNGSITFNGTYKEI